MTNGVLATLQLPEAWLKKLVTSSGVTISRCAVVHHEGGEWVFNVDPSAQGVCYIHPSECKGELQVAELFAGQGGWTYAARKIVIGMR